MVSTTPAKQVENLSAIQQEPNGSTDGAASSIGTQEETTFTLDVVARCIPMTNDVESLNIGPVASNSTISCQLNKHSQTDNPATEAADSAINYGETYPSNFDQ